MKTFLITVLVSCLSTVAFGQQRPLVTEDPETVGAGRLLIEGGVEYDRDITFPVSGLNGNLLRVPMVGVSVGVSSIAEIQIDGVSLNRLSIEERVRAPLSAMVTATGSSTTDSDDLLIGTKVTIAGETTSRPAFGFRFATKLPNASNESGLGLDTTDFFASVLVGKTSRSVRIVGNGGIGILGDPTRGDRQNDVLTYGVSVARALTDAAEIVAEVHGRVNTRNGDPPPGTESRSIARLGVRYTVNGWRADGAVLVGLTSTDPSLGVTGGFTFVFDAFQVP